MTPQENGTQSHSEPQNAGAPNGDATPPNANSAEAADKRVAELEALVKEKEAKYVYLYAEFENAKKRAIKERSDLIKYGWENVARELLQVVDNLERAVEHMPTGVDANFASGLRMIVSQFKGAMQKQGVEEVPSLSQTFDPNLHEAVGQEASTQHSEGTVSKELSKGYTLYGRLLRPARVLISSGAGTTGPSLAQN